MKSGHFKRFGKVVSSEEGEVVHFDEMVDARRCAYETMDAQPSARLRSLADVHPGDLEIVAHVLIEGHPVHKVGVGCEEWLDQEHSSGGQMACHGCDGALQPGDRSEVADRAKEAADHIKPSLEEEVRHISLVQGNCWDTRLCPGKHLAAAVQAFNVEIFGQYFEVPSG